jgi:hypothetical protein
MSAAATYLQSIDGCLTDAIGTHGLARATLVEYLARLEPALTGLRSDYASGQLPLLRICERTDDIAETEAALNRLCTGAQTIVFFGTGGSGLGGQTLAQVAGWNIPGGGKVYDRSQPRTRFL